MSTFEVATSRVTSLFCLGDVHRVRYKLLGKQKNKILEINQYQYNLSMIFTPTSGSHHLEGGGPGGWVIDYLILLASNLVF